MTVRKVRPAGSIWWRGRELYISETSIGEPVALERIDEQHFQVYYANVKLALYDDRKQRLIRPTVTRRRKR